MKKRDFRVIIMKILQLLNQLWKSYSFIFIIWPIEDDYVALLDLCSTMLYPINALIISCVLTRKLTFPRLRTKVEKKRALFFTSIILLVRKFDSITNEKQFFVSSGKYIFSSCVTSHAKLQYAYSILRSR